MKTLAVLSALVGLAVAAPAPQNRFQQNGFQPNEFHGLDTADGIHPINFNTEMNGPVNSARSHANPVIVKKKTGYHLYRDSKEERADADPRESCGKQVRVKFCDDSIAKSADLRRSTKNENMNPHKDEVEDSIKLAKEAVESLQRDLKTIEHDTTGKSAQWKHGPSDKDLHKDIEAARQALEHAETNFGNLESMSMRAATLRDGEELLNTNKAKTHEERMAQWKTAMANIQRNVEIARNLEESFKAAEHDTSLFGSEAIDTSKLMRSENHENNFDFQKTIKGTTSATSSRKTVEEKSDKKAVETKSEHHSVTEKKAEHFGEDMKSSASESVHVKHQATQGKSAQGSTNTKSDSSTLKTAHSNIQQAAASLRSANTENLRLHDKSMHSNSAHRITLNKDINSRAPENTHHHISGHKDESSNIKKTWASHADSQHKTIPHGKNAHGWESSIADKNIKHEKSAWSETEHKDLMMKSAEHVQTLKSHEHANAQGTLDSLTHQHSMKAAEHNSENKNDKIDGEQLLKKSGSSVHSDMRLADSVVLASNINLNAPANVQLNHEANLNSDISKKGKEAELPKGLDQEQARGSYGGGSHYGHGHHDHDHGHHDHGHYDHGHAGHGYGNGQHGHGYGYKHGYGHHKHGYHGKSVEIDSDMHPSMQKEINDFSEKSAMENMFQWKHHHDGGRSAYGLGAYGGALNLAGGGSGAVGVFPHSKIGGCGVPLLLSCSPSVVSGSLVKSHGYAAAATPAYRSTEESNTKNKRDVIKVKETSINKIDDVTKSTKLWN